MPTLFYQFTNLESFILTRNTFTVSDTGDVSVVLVQYKTGCATGGWGCGVDLTYAIVSDNDASCIYPLYGPIEVNGAYKDTSQTIVFKNVSPGTYRLCIRNKDFAVPADGNGYIYYG
ncbi:MAG: hypothetical protein IMW93_02555 [Thermoanaerobacteraceae bacterium]|nr:hypothetical protein [Thermoanaerobacteraceae bacterium]